LAQAQHRARLAPVRLLRPRCEAATGHGAEPLGAARGGSSRPRRMQLELARGLRSAWWRPAAGSRASGSKRCHQCFRRSGGGVEGASCAGGRVGLRDFRRCSVGGSCILASWLCRIRGSKAPPAPWASGCRGHGGGRARGRPKAPAEGQPECAAASKDADDLHRQREHRRHVKTLAGPHPHPERPGER